MIYYFTHLTRFAAMKTNFFVLCGKTGAMKRVTLVKLFRFKRANMIDSPTLYI